MKTRIITAIVAILILLPVLIFSNTVLFPIAMAICSVIAIYEMSACIGVKKEWAFTVPVYLIAAGMPFLVRYCANPHTVRQSVTTLLCVFLLYFFALMTFSHGKYKLADVAVWVITALYILVGFNAILMVRDYEDAGNYVYLMIFIGAWVTDTFAYFCGMLFGKGGKHKLIPDVSPKKTVEGSIGGIVFCILSMLLFGWIIEQIDIQWKADDLLLAVAGLVISVVSQVGDLCMSFIKRTYGIKDYGKLFPGHGGVLDRFDSILAVASILAVFCSYFNFFQDMIRV